MSSIDQPGASSASRQFIPFAYVFAPVVLKASLLARIPSVSTSTRPQRPESRPPQAHQSTSSTLFVAAETPSLLNSDEPERETTGHSFQAKLLYDGDCPVCIRNIELLQMLDRRQRVDFVDVASPFYEPDEHGGVELEDAMEKMTAVLRDGSVVQGMDAVRAVYAAMGLGWLVAPTSWPLLRLAFDRLYEYINSNRYTLLGQKMCDSSCSLTTTDSRTPSPDLTVQPAPVKHARPPSLQ